MTANSITSRRRGPAPPLRDGVKLYVDGVLVGQAAALASTTTDTHVISFGGHPVIAYNRYAGMIDEVAIYNRALTQFEVQNAMAGSTYTQSAGSTTIQGGLYAGTIDLEGGSVDLNGGVVPAADNYWRGESSTTAADSVGPITGTFAGGATTIDGRFGRAFQFDGVNDYVNLGRDASLDKPGDMTIATWVRLDALTGGQYLIADFDAGGNISQGSLCQSVSSFCWHQTTNAADPYGPNNGRITTGPAVVANQWYHVAVVRDDAAKTVQMYVNGVLYGSSTYTGSVVPLQRDKFLGGAGVEFTSAFTRGRLDEVMFFERPLSPGEVAQLASASAYAVLGSSITASGQIVGNVEVSPGFTLDGTGLIDGNLQNLGTVAPGNSPGVIVVNGDYVQNAGATLEIEIQGTAAATPDFDQLIVNGTVTLDGSLNISFLGGFTPTAGNVFTIIRNDGVDEITPLPSLPEGSLFNVSGTTFLITYHGGDGNDLELIVPTSAASDFSLDSSGNLIISGSNVADQLTLWSDAANSQFVVHDAANLLNTLIVGATGNGSNTITIPFAVVTGSQIRIFALDGDDSLTVDHSLGNFAKGINYYGGSQAAGDSLTLTGGGPFASVAHVFTTSAEGTVAAAGNGTVFYTNLEPLIDNLSAAARAFTFNAGAETITLDDASGEKMTVASTLARSITFATPAASLVINAGAGSDVISINSFDATFVGALSIDGGASVDSVTLAADLSLAVGNSLTVSGETIAISSGTDFVTSGAGAISLTADDLSIAASASLNAGTSTATIQTATAGREIDLGTETIGRLSLTDAELDRISAGTLSIGNASSGAITVAQRSAIPAIRTLS